MKIFGVEVKHPSPSQLGLATTIIVSFFLINVVAAYFDGRAINTAFPMVAAVSAGIISTACGISPVGGWRACTLLFVLSLVAYIAVLVITGQLELPSS